MAWTARTTGLHLWHCCLCRMACGTSRTTPAMRSPEAMPSCKSLNRSSLMLSLQGRQQCPSGWLAPPCPEEHLGMQSLLSPFGSVMAACACWLAREL